MAADADSWFARDVHLHSFAVPQVEACNLPEQLNRPDMLAFANGRRNALALGVRQLRLREGRPTPLAADNGLLI